MIYLDVNKTVTVPVNTVALTDDTDGISRETGVLYNAAGMDLVYNFVTTSGIITQDPVTPTATGDYAWVEIGDAMYQITIPASGGTSINNNKTGTGYFTGDITGILHFRSPDLVFRDEVINNKLIDDDVTPATRSIITSGGADAHYGTVSNADEYFTLEQIDRGNTWASLPVTTKTILLKQATKRVDRLNFLGSKTDSTQKKEFPRDPDTAVPDNIVTATYEIAGAMANGRDIEYEDETLGTTEQSFANFRSLRNGVSYSEARIHRIPSTLAWDLLKPFLRDGRTFDLTRVN